MSNKWTSRKFLAVLGGCLTAIGGALTQSIDPLTALQTIVALIFGYIFVEGAADVVTRAVD